MAGARLPPGTASDVEAAPLARCRAASSIINASTHPAGKLDPWRRQVNCLFGLAIDGTPIANHTGTNKYDPTNTYTCPNTENFQVDRLPLEATVAGTPHSTATWLNSCRNRP